MHSRSRLHDCRTSANPLGGLRRLGALAVLMVAAAMWTAAPAHAVVGDPVIATAADIACDPNYPVPRPAGQCHEQQTAALAAATPNLAAVLPVGDLQYECGGAGTWLNGPFDLSWGQFKSKMYPVPGNHEYNTTAQAPAGATGCTANDPPAIRGSEYTNYFNAAPAGINPGGKFPSYYSYQIGGWHIVALNTNQACDVTILGCRTGSVQEKWLKKDLADHPAACTLAYFHHPLFSSSTLPTSLPWRALWQDLYDAGAEVILGGHVHHYERFAPQTPAGAADPRFGIREFIVGSGGRSLEKFSTIAANSEARGKSYGILRITLHANSYDWQFVPDGSPGSTFTDAGTNAACHDAPDFTPPTVSVTAPANGATVHDATTIAASAADAHGVARVDFLVDGKVVGTDATAPYSAPWDTTTARGGSHTVSARAFDIYGNQATASVTVIVDNSIVVLPPGTPAGAPRPSGNIYRVRVAGGGLTRVTQAPLDVDYGTPAWSRDGRLIAFSGPTCAGCATQIFLVGPGGGGLRQLTGTPPGATRPSWGRLDRSLTFVGGRTNAVFTVATTGRGLRRLTGGLLPHDQSAWSPDGKQIVFTTQQRNGGWDLFLMNANGSRKRNLTATSKISEVQPAWAHDGSRIAFTRQVNGRSTLWVMGTGPGRARRAKLIARGCQQPAWSPNDRLIACTRFTATGSTILILRANGTLLRRLSTGTASASAPTWSPDGRRIAFVSHG